MKQFLTNCIAFSCLTLFVVVGLILITHFFCKTTFNFTIPKSKNILIIGDSHPACSINDAFIPNAFNIAQGGSEYFYNYLKLREIIDRNPHIDTVVVGYAYINVAKGRDSWLLDTERIKYMIRTHFFLFRLNDYWELFRANPLGTISQTPQVIFYNLKNPFVGYSTMGGYQKLTYNKLDEAAENYLAKKDEFLFAYSTYQEKYLLKIYNYCQEKGIKVILLNTPMHQIMREYEEMYRPKYCELALEKMSNARIINHARFDMPDDGFADLGHLNAEGAKLYSEYLRKNLWGNSLEDCKGE